MTAHTPDPARPDWPRLRPLGLDGLLISFGDRLSEPANRAALAFRAALDGAKLPGVLETTTSLASAYLRFDPFAEGADTIDAAVTNLLASRDWTRADLPRGRRLWRIPTVFGTDLAPQLNEAATRAGLTPDQAIKSIAETRVRVQTIGFAPGQPYLGELPEAWNIPRQSELTPRVPVGALTVAIRQLVLFAISAPTGWRHIGQTPFQPFQPESDRPFVLNPGDEVFFDPITADDYDRLKSTGPDGGATWDSLE